MRGDLVSRPIGDVLKEAKALFEGGVKELLVISQDTSAYGVDVKYRTGFWDGRPVKTRMLELVQALGELAGHGAWVRLHYVYPVSARRRSDPADGAGQGPALPRRAVPAQPPRRAAPMKRPASGEKNLERIRAGASSARARDPQHLHRRLPRRDRGGVRAPAGLPCARRRSTAPAASLQPGGGRRANELPGMLPQSCARSAARASWRWPRKSPRASWRRVGATMQVLVDSAPALGRKGGVGRSYADAPEIDGTVRLLPPQS